MISMRSRPIFWPRRRRWPWSMQRMRRLIRQSQRRQNPALVVASCQGTCRVLKRLLQQTSPVVAALSVTSSEKTARPCSPLVREHWSSERSNIVPAQFRMLVTRRPKFACRSCEASVIQASAKPRPTCGGMPTEATVASVIVSKYVPSRDIVPVMTCPLRLTRS